MKNTEQPNLFSYATSELSQDAFICWLAAWADAKWKETNPALHKAGRDFVASMIRRVVLNYDSSDVKTIDILRQAGRLDVLIEVNKELPDKLVILVEDKTHTSNHSDQLNRYYNQVKLLGYEDAEMIPLYFKTGYQSKFDTLGVFKTYLREHFLTVLRKGKGDGVNNAIFDDFLSHIEKLDVAVRQFSYKGIGTWSDGDWRGFYMVLYKLLEGYEADWGDVHNRAGGFIAFWWYGVISHDLQYKSYLQLETPFRKVTEAEKLVYNLSFKIRVEDKSLSTNAWHSASSEILKAGEQLGINLTRPKRTSGQSMTVARWTGEYRVFTDGVLDLDATLANLKKAQSILDLAFKHDALS